MWAAASPRPGASAEGDVAPECGSSDLSGQLQTPIRRHPVGHLEDKEALVVGDGSGESSDDLHRRQGQGLAGGGIGGAALQADPACRCAIGTQDGAAETKQCEVGPTHNERSMPATGGRTQPVLCGAAVNALH